MIRVRFAWRVAKTRAPFSDRNQSTASLATSASSTQSNFGEGALFQVTALRSSNALEMIGPDVARLRWKITRYQFEPDWGPPARSRIAATIYAASLPVGGQSSQTRDDQLDSLARSVYTPNRQEARTARRPSMDDAGRLRALCSDPGLRAIERVLSMASETGDALGQKCIAGLAVCTGMWSGPRHSGAFLTRSAGSAGFCSNCRWPMSPPRSWTSFMKLILEGGL